MTAISFPTDIPFVSAGAISPLWGGTFDPDQDFYPGALLAFDPSDQLIKNAEADPTFVTLGIYRGQQLSIVSGSSFSQATQIQDIEAGTALLQPGTGLDAIPITTAPGTVLYVIDSATVGLTDANGTRPPAGTYAGQWASSTSGFLIGPGGSTGIANQTGVWVQIYPTQFQQVDGGDAGLVPVESGVTRTARLLATSLATYVVDATTLEITAASNGALSAIDSVTAVVGDRVLLIGGAAGEDNAIYEIESVGGASAKWKMKLAADWQTGQVVSAMLIAISEGTIYAGQFARLTTTGTITVGTTSVAFGILPFMGSTTTLGNLPIAQGAGQPAALTNKIGISHSVRGVAAFSNIADLTAFTVANNDGLTFAAGDRVLVVAQTTKSQNGIYVVGTVASTTAPLTRPTDFAAGAILAPGTTFEVNAGTLFANSTWKITTAGSITVDTTTFDAYPGRVTQSVALTSSAATITNVPILSATKTNILASLNTTGGTLTSTVGYGTIAPATPGAAGASPSAQVVALASGMGKNGTSDTSTVTVTIINF